MVTSCLARVTSNGALDSSFTLNNTINNSGIVLTIAQQPDGKLLLGGSFIQFNGQPALRVVYRCT